MVKSLPLEKRRGEKCQEEARYEAHLGETNETPLVPPKYLLICGATYFENRSLKSQKQMT